MGHKYIRHNLIGHNYIGSPTEGRSAPSQCHGLLHLTASFSTPTEHTADARAVHLHDAREPHHTSQGLRPHATSGQQLNFRISRLHGMTPFCSFTWLPEEAVACMCRFERIAAQGQGQVFPWGHWHRRLLSGSREQGSQKAWQKYNES